ncbi:hypothetical protein COK69_26705, partial [Bacillus cereus]
RGAVSGSAGSNGASGTIGFCWHGVVPGSCKLKDAGIERSGDPSRAVQDLDGESGAGRGADATRGECPLPRGQPGRALGPGQPVPAVEHLCGGLRDGDG